MTAAEFRYWQMNQMFASLLPEIEVFPPGLIVYAADETIYMHSRPEFASQVEVLDRAAYDRSIVKQYGMSWDEYHLRVLGERQQQMLAPASREEGYHAEGDYGVGRGGGDWGGLGYSGGNWGRSSWSVFRAADQAYNAYGGGGSGFNYLDFVSSYVAGQVNPNDTNGFYYTPQTVTGSTETNAEGEEVLVSTATRGVWVPLGDGTLGAGGSGSGDWATGGYQNVGSLYTGPYAIQSSRLGSANLYDASTWTLDAGCCPTTRK
jgi:hypothetical protein